MRTLVLAGVAVLALAGCSSSRTGSQPATSVSKPAAVAGATAPAATETKAATVQDATTLAADLKATVPEVASVTTYTAATDPAGLMGRPGEYTSIASLADVGGATKSVASGNVTMTLGTGAVVEVFATAADAATRASVIDSISDKLGGGIREWHYLAGPDLLRVLPGTAAEVNAKYAAAWATVTSPK